MCGDELVMTCAWRSRRAWTDWADELITLFACSTATNNSNTNTRKQMHRHEGNAQSVVTVVSILSQSWVIVPTLLRVLKNTEMCSENFQKNRTLKFVTATP